VWCSGKVRGGALCAGGGRCCLAEDGGVTCNDGLCPLAMGLKGEVGWWGGEIILRGDGGERGA